MSVFRSSCPSRGRARLLALALVAAAPLALAQQPAPPQPAPPQAPAPAASAASPAKPVNVLDAIPLDEIRRYVIVHNAIRQAYVEPVEDRKLMQSAIRGLLLELDPHSAYLPRAEAEAFSEDFEGYGGIGVEVQQQTDGSILIIAPIDDTPAARAGIKAGDIIIAVDGKLLGAGDAAANPLRGAPGTRVALRIVRAGAPKPLEFQVERQIVRISSVRGRMLEPGYGYLRVSAFQVDTATDFSGKLDRLQAEAGGKLRGLVIDLRSNPGGLVVAAVQIADELLERGRIVSTRGRVPLSETEFNATPGDRMRGAPVVVLIDAGSASASEVLAAALRDNGRARLIGSRSFGKGSVQTVLPLDNGDSVKLTTARYYTPSGASIQARGIDPDVVLKPDGKVQGGPGGISEAALSGHLRGDGEGGEVRVGDVLEGEAPVTAALALLKQPMPAPAPAAAAASTAKPQPATPASPPAPQAAPAAADPAATR